MTKLNVMTGWMISRTHRPYVVDDPPRTRSSGVGHRINSASFLLIQAAGQVRRLDDSQCMNIFMDECGVLSVVRALICIGRDRGSVPRRTIW